MNVRRFAALIVIAGVLSGTTVRAHFLWLVADGGAEEARVYFSESAEADDPALLDKLDGLQVWKWEGRNEVKTIDAARDGAALKAGIGRAQTVGLSRRYGVITRGGESFLLHYHAKGYASPLPIGGAAVKDVERLPLEIAAKRDAHSLELTLLWQGQPLADAPLVLWGAGLDKTDTQTDGNGQVRCQPTADGLLEVRAKHVVQEAGELDGQKYGSIRHWTTLTLPCHSATMQSKPHHLAPLQQGVTSFGAAVAGDWLYQFGGQLGGAHHYWREGQSPDFQRLNLTSGGDWEKLPAGPRRTGTALVTHRGLLYRVGGFEARNDEKAESDLHSMSDVERFDPATGEWTTLPAMPAGRSSHDAAVLGDTLYVVGGWELNGPGSSVWHPSMLALDLSAADLKWESIEVPFRRRALTVAAHDGKLFVIGGMQEQGGITTAVEVYDPAARTWSAGPKLHGEPLEGFGGSAFAWNGRLHVTTRSGAIQQLAEDGKSWRIVGELQHPRFFHRLLPISAGRAVVVGGASMESGKVLELEILADAPAAISADSAAETTSTSANP